ncbi:hypothetical protein KI427_16635 [Rhodococcus ruber]|uniref:DUF7196 family protein n=1 Tax=Rhodococcus ruber TaxID=1830 RepID=UPI0007443FC1|nr:hypothetical protein CSW53_13115 [Rhodococcus ruber]UQB71245.1 hypothetical protein KI427_16635 [Rhodococcus ruber]
MGCGCGRRAGSTLAGSSTATSYTYKVTLPSGEEATYLTPLEAKREVRRAGGGTIVRVADTPTS